MAVAPQHSQMIQLNQYRCWLASQGTREGTKRHPFKDIQPLTEVITPFSQVQKPAAVHKVTQNGLTLASANQNNQFMNHCSFKSLPVGCPFGPRSTSKMISGSNSRFSGCAYRHQADAGPQHRSSGTGPHPGRLPGGCMRAEQQPRQSHV